MSAGPQIDNRNLQVDSKVLLQKSFVYREFAV